MRLTSDYSAFYELKNGVRQRHGCTYPWSEQNKRIGWIYLDRVHDEIYSEMGKVKKTFEEVITIEGLLTATQDDIKWRDDLFSGWDYYDLSQSMEFRRTG